MLERIYINGDGAGWIKSGADIHAKAIFVLDKFHLHKYILAATSHLMDSKEDARIEIWQGIKRKSKKSVKSTFEHILYLTESESKQAAVEKAQTYILSNWLAIMNGIKNETDNLHCSAEGHVSHIYADRMSSRPLGWSRIGADKMSRLRVYQFNGGDMLELVRFQKEDIPKAAGAESIGVSAAEVMVSINKNKQALGIVADLPWYSIPYPQIRKIAAIKNHIYGL